MDAMGLPLEEAAPSLFDKPMHDGTRRNFERLYRIAQGQAEFSSVSITQISRYPRNYHNAARMLRALRDNGQITHIPEKGLRPVWYRWKDSDAASRSS